MIGWVCGYRRVCGYRMVRMAPLRMQLLRRRFSTSAGKPNGDERIKAISDFVDGYYSQVLRNSAKNLLAAGVFIGLGNFGLRWYRGDEEKEALMLEEWRNLKVSSIVGATNELAEIKGTLQGILEEMKFNNKRAEEDKDRIWFYQIPGMNDRDPVAHLERKVSYLENELKVTELRLGKTGFGKGNKKA